MTRQNLVNNHGVFHIPFTKVQTSYLIDLSLIDLDHSMVVIAPEALFDIVLLNGKGDHVISFEFADHCEGKLQVAMMKENKNLTIHGNVNTSVQLEAALADFTNGKGRVIVDFEMIGRDSHLEWRTAALASANDRKYYSISFTHKNFNTYANMTNYGVTEGQSSLQFSGTGYIINGAKFSKTHQAAKIMVFDKKCLGRADPVLKIDENEVEASHAATVGKVNDEHLFYLCSRGLSETEAKRLITLGYLNPILAYFTDEAMKDVLANQISKGR
jgi:Fe-S cluster assembly scaffold protein SufB